MMRFLTLWELYERLAASWSRVAGETSDAQVKIKASLKASEMAMKAHALQQQERYRRAA